MSARVLLQVLNDVVTDRPASVAARHSVSAQGRVNPGCVQAEAAVTPAPARGNLAGSLQDKRFDPASLEHPRDREASGAGAGDDYLLPVHDRTISARCATSASRARRR